MFFRRQKSAHKPNSQSSRLRCQRGQGLVEYLIIVSLMGVASIVVIRVMSQSLNSKFATVAAALQGQTKKHTVEVPDSLFKQKKDLGTFMNGVASEKGDGQGD